MIQEAHVHNIQENIDLDALNQRFFGCAPEEVLTWAVETFSDNVAMTTSFQASGVALIHLVRTVAPDIPIYFIDTGFHFPETLAFKERLTKDWDLNVITLSPSVLKEEQEKLYGRHLYERDPDLCCRINKADPFHRFKQTTRIKNWISALRSDQSRARSQYETFMSDDAGFLRIHPMITWKRVELWHYIHEHSLPFHPLYDQGYTSIGCFPVCCTTKATDELHERTGRWNGKEKQECGLHLNLNGSTSGNNNKKLIEVVREYGE